MLPPLEPAVQFTDVRALRARAYPLRNRLLGLLRLHGPLSLASGHLLAGEHGQPDARPAQR
jgi:hypothetical protein